MKLAWLVWWFDDSEYPVVVKVEPDYCYKKVQIVYAEVEGA